uniref:Putative ovule protein n=1 Tax=Solanum chacoense TaxID=4108 RepID=A0A0V0HVD7_SOLCH
MGDSRGPYTDMDDLHVSVRTISTHYHKIKQSPTRMISTCLIYSNKISQSPSQTISPYPTYTQSQVNACAQYDFNKKG